MRICNNLCEGRANSGFREPRSPSPGSRGSPAAPPIYIISWYIIIYIYIYIYIYNAYDMI